MSETQYLLPFPGSPRHPRTKQQGGFTLVELLVVLAVLAILASILFPVFARARAGARQIVCMSNMDQVLKAHLLYLQDNDDRFSPDRVSSSRSSSPLFGADAGHEAAPDGHTWRASVAPYLKSPETMVCADNPNRNEPMIEGFMEKQQKLPLSYAYNMHRFDDPTGTSLAGFLRTSDVMMLLESRARFPDLGTWCYSERTCDFLRADFQTHGATANWGFVDGHVKAMTHLVAAGSGVTSIWRDDEPPYGATWWIPYVKSLIQGNPAYR